MNTIKSKLNELSILVHEFERLIETCFSDLDYYYKDCTIFHYDKKTIKKIG